MYLNLFLYLNILIFSSSSDKFSKVDSIKISKSVTRVILHSDDIREQRFERVGDVPSVDPHKLASEKTSDQNSRWFPL